MKLNKVIVGALLAVAAVLMMGACDTPSSASGTPAYVGTYTSTNKDVTITVTIADDGTCTFKNNSEEAVAGTYKMESDTKATITFGEVTLTATTTDGWKTFTTESTTEGYGGSTFTKQ